MKKRLFLVFLALAAAGALGFAYRTVYYPAEWGTNICPPVRVSRSPSLYGRA